MGQTIHRLTPTGPPAAYKTYAIDSPLATHWRPATCAEVGCPAHINGWRTVLPAGSDLIDLLKRSGRHYIERPVDGGLVEFTFEAGQACFQADEHRVPLERPELYLVRGGDWRGDPRGLGTRVHSGPDAWVNDFGEHQDRLNRRLGGP